MATDFLVRKMIIKNNVHQNYGMCHVCEASDYIIELLPYITLLVTDNWTYNLPRSLFYQTVSGPNYGSGPK